MRWIADQAWEDRYSFWTRANVIEVLPEPVSPLGWDLVWAHGACLAGWRDLFVDRCGMAESDLDVDHPQMAGIFGGYAYLGASLFRVWAGRVPGMTPTTIDEVYFSDHPDVPPYVHEPWHDNEATTAKMTEWLGWVTVGRDQSELEEDRAESLRIAAARPDHENLSDQELFDFAVAKKPLLRRMFNQHINQSLAASVGPGILAPICEAIGKPQVAMRLIAGLGGVDSAAPSYALWAMSRAVRGNAALNAAFDGGVDGLEVRLRKAAARGEGYAAGFLADFDHFIAEFGSRGPNEWDIATPSWELNPAGPLAYIDRMRLAPDTASPLAENAARGAERHQLETGVRNALAGDAEALGGFEVGLASSATFLPGRERSKTSIIRVIHEIRMAVRELGRRAAERGNLSNPDHIYLLFVDELADLVAGKLAGAAALTTERAEYREWLAGLEPPFIIASPPPPNTTWPRRGAVPAAPALVVGESIIGVAGCPGEAVGRARVVLDAFDPTALNPGDILVAPITDPSWTPLFVGAAAVVVDTGAMLSHAVIVSRELGIPCVASAHDATRRIPNGALIGVNGDTGTVTMLEAP